MASRLPSARHQAMLATPTGYRRWTWVTATRGGVTEQFEPIRGRFTQDVRRGGRWDGTLAFTGVNLPTRPGDLLTPFGSVVTVELGLETLDGTVSSVPYGTYEIGSARTTTSADEQTVEIGLIDRSDQIERYRFETPFTVPSGAALSTMVRDVVFDRTGRDPDLAAIANTLGAARVFGLDVATAPWSEVLDVLAGFSLTAWYDRSGRIQIGAISSSPSSAYALDALTSTSADFDTRPANVVVARGEAPNGTPPVQAVAMDTDPGSPTYAGTTAGSSPYGRKTEFFSSPLILTASQAQSAADTILAGNLGAGATSTMTRPYDPTIDAGDVVSFGGFTYVVDAITVDLTGETEGKLRQL